MQRAADDDVRQPAKPQPLILLGEAGDLRLDGLVGLRDRARARVFQ